MCCEDTPTRWAPAVEAALARYRSMVAARSYDWAGESDEDALVALLGPLSKVLEVRHQLAVVSAFREADPAVATAVAVRALPDPPPPRLAVIHPDRVDVGLPLPLGCGDQPVSYVVARDASADMPASITSLTITAADPDLLVDGTPVRLVDVVPSAHLRLVADEPCRWSVVDERGGAWFPQGALQKYDFHDRPFFHGNLLDIEVPAGRITVTAARGCEFRPVTVEIDATPERTSRVEVSLERLYDAAARGWYGGDLHVHMNYSGDFVCSPDQAGAMQVSEGLHLMNLVAANCLTALIYEREALESHAGEDLPWSAQDTVARFGVEYRNDRLGHFHALNPSRAPVRYNTGHERSDEPQDWPPNAVAAAEFRALGATVGYTHPVMVAMGPDGSPEPVFARQGNHARELVVDAALGLVDSVDLTGGPNHLEATEYLYHRLLGCGLRLAATAGTDTMLSYAHATVLSNPPGWCRAYANLRGEPLSVPAWQEAVRAGRTFATNGPWLEIDVAGRGPGELVSLGRQDSLDVVVRVDGLGVQRVDIVGPAGVIASRNPLPGVEHVELTARVDVDEPTWLAAVVRGPRHLAVPGPQVYAHTTPVYVDVDGRSVARAADATWCLDWIDRLEAFMRAHGHFPEPHQLTDLIDVLDRGRAFYREIAGP